jgi:hypothetical protein
MDGPSQNAPALKRGTAIDDVVAGLREMPHGTVKRSGFGKDLSMFALED